MAADVKLSQSEVPDPTPDIETARRALGGFLEKIKPEDRIVCLHDSDADGVTAGVVWQRAIMGLGYRNVKRLIPNRERNAWTPGNKAIVEAEKPDFLFVMDLGSQPEAVVENVPICFVDHHRPGGALETDTLISAYTWEPTPNTSLIVYDLFSPLTDITADDWIAAIGTTSDLGERAPFELLAAAKKKYTAKYLKDATSLLNAPRRAAQYEPEIAAEALLKHASPRELVNSTDETVEKLRRAKAEVNAELGEARKVAPVFAGDVALIQFSSACQIHPLLVQGWLSRLPSKFVVISANTGYMPGRVNFAARSKGVNVLEFLRGIKLDVTEGSYGQGHDQASGGSLPFKTWNELLAKLGFPEKTFVAAA